MPHETLTPRDLVSDARQGRFLQELSDHLEDSGDPAAIGAPAELADTFNAYARPSRNRRLLFLVCIAMTTFVFTFVVTQAVFLENHFFERLLNQLPPFISNSIFMVGGLLQMPATLLVVGLSLLVAPLTGMPPQWILGLVPFISSGFWTLVTVTLLFSPYEIFKRNLKRRT